METKNKNNNKSSYRRKGTRVEAEGGGVWGR